LPEDVSPLFTDMSNQACGVPVAAIGKVGMPLVSGGYGAADTFSKDEVDAIRQRTCEECAFAR